MQALRDLWASANTTVRVVVVCAVVAVAVAGLAYGVGLDWLTDLLAE